MYPVIFAHGLESSPEGTKASYLRERFGALTPLLRELDLDGQVDALGDLLFRGEHSVVVGSSLGALAALGAAQRVPEKIAHLVLLAPAVGVEHRADVFREAVKDRPGIYEQAMRISSFSVPTIIPCTIVHGLGDDVVRWVDVVNLSLRSPSSRLILVHDDHPLRASGDLILSVVEMAASGQDPIVFSRNPEKPQPHVI